MGEIQGCINGMRWCVKHTPLQSTVPVFKTSSCLKGEGREYGTVSISDKTFNKGIRCEFDLCVSPLTGPECLPVPRLPVDYFQFSKHKTVLGS